MKEQGIINDFIPPHNEYYGEIYKTTNLINGKQYVGQTVRNKVKNYYGSGKIIKQSIKKYSIKNFKRETLECCNNRFELNKREKYWIKKLNTRVPNGYNLTEGGEGMSGYIMPEEHKKNIKKRNY